MWICEPVVSAVSMTRKFWRLFGPLSPSPASFGVTPDGSASVVRSIPRPPFEWIEVPRMRLASADPLSPS